MRERLTGEEIRAGFQELIDDDPNTRHSLASYTSGAMWAEAQYREAPAEAAAKFTEKFTEPAADRRDEQIARDEAAFEPPAEIDPVMHVAYLTWVRSTLDENLATPEHWRAWRACWDAAEASRDPAVLSYLARPQGEIVRAGLPPLGSRWVSPTYGTGVVVKTRHNEDRADELWIRYDSDKLKQPLWCTIPSFYNYQEYDFSQPGVDNDREPWALQSETCACRLDSTGLHLCADSAGDVEILMRRHVWDALLSQCLLIAPPAPPKLDWPAWWATTWSDTKPIAPLTRVMEGGQKYDRELRADGTVLLTPIVGNP